MTSNQSVTLVVNALPDPPVWSAPAFPFMAAEDEAMLVGGVSLSDPDNERYLRVNVWAEKGRVALPGAADALLDVEEGIADDGQGDGSFEVVGNETALNLALVGLVYFPPPDWTSFKQVRRLRRVGYSC